MLVRKGDLSTAMDHVYKARSIIQSQKPTSAIKLMLSHCEYAEGLVHYKAGHKAEAVYVTLHCMHTMIPASNKTAVHTWRRQRQ
jgi:hypothetical protein